jgi:hypothetical protein
MNVQTRDGAGLRSSIILLLLLGCADAGSEAATAVGRQPSQLASASLYLYGTPDIVVNTTADVQDIGGALQVGDLPGADGLVSLREAILAANRT